MTRRNNVPRSTLRSKPPKIRIRRRSSSTRLLANSNLDAIGDGSSRPLTLQAMIRRRLIAGYTGTEYPTLILDAGASRDPGCLILRRW
ncbi:hypothetical protein BHE74_00000393 [Ensete ventricosum]|nr:hypothetical protein BHE74_00000393 [Ensete ventricosum]